MYNLCLLFLLVCNFTVLDAYERITSFISDIKVNVDATLEVQESIEVISEHKQIIHGLVREFPTKYRDSHGANYVVDFVIQSITHNGCDVPYKIKSVANGKKIYIGDKDKFVSKGQNHYVITYITNRQIGFFKDHDELYWNVTGTGWRLPIDTVQARVHLPQGITHDVIDAQAYIGYQGEQGKNYNCCILDNRIYFATKDGLKEYEGLTIVTTFPKGYIIQPSNYQKTYWFFRDNFLILLFIIGFLLLLAIMVFGVMTARTINKPGIVTPLFYAPTGMMPCDIGYMSKMKFDNVLLSSDIVNLAVRNFITITYQKNILYGGTYILTIKDSIAEVKTDQSIDDYDKKLLAALFGTKKSVTISQKDSDRMQAALQICKKRTTEYCGSYMTTLTNYWYALVFFILLLACCSLYFIYNFMYVDATVFFMGTFILICFTFLLKKMFRVYTSAGRKKQDAIDGFTLYLAMAEVERMNLIGTPPTKTPELYEKYLPYAIALGIEKQWTAQFASVFKQFEIEKGYAYHPIWYHGQSFKIDNFRSGFTSSFNSSIASSSIHSSGSSGSGGKGRSGGGGGGGGGGGW